MIIYIMHDARDKTRYKIATSYKRALYNDIILFNYKWSKYIFVVTNRQTDILLTEKKAIQTYLS